VEISKLMIAVWLDNHFWINLEITGGRFNNTQKLLKDIRL
jgi:hypothetical protein